jgi:hypothetical protein
MVITCRQACVAVLTGIFAGSLTRSHRAATEGMEAERSECRRGVAGVNRSPCPSERSCRWASWSWDRVQGLEVLDALHGRLGRREASLPPTRLSGMRL